MSLQSASSITPASPETRYIRPLFRRDFQIAIICALPLEYDAASLLVDEFWDEGGKQYGRTSGDSNTYRNGRIGMHNVVLMLLPGMGKVAIAVSAASLRTSYSGLRLAFLVGVCGGAPGIHEILLGDVVVSDDVIQYDFGRQYPGTFVPKETVASSRVSSKDIRSLIAYFQTEPGKRDLQGDAAKHLKALQEASIFQGYQHRYVCPGAKEDKLFAASYHHKHRRSSCNLCRVETETFCEEASKTPCAKLGCDEGELVGRKRLQEQDKSPQVFIGRIASGDTVMKSGKHRDEVAKQYDVIAFEMEGAGIWDEIPSIIVKGVCDYADSHKNKSWQPFAAATAAAVTKSMLTRYSLTDGTEMSMQVVDAPQSHSNLLGTKQKERLHMQSLVPFTAARKGQWQPLQEAISHFQRGLSEPQSRELRSTKVVPNVDSVLIFTAQLDYNNRTRKGTSIGSRFYSILQSVREFCVAVESFPSWPSKIAVLLWGSLKLTINVIFKLPSYYEALSKFFMALGPFFPLSADYKVVFVTSSELRESLVKFFSSVIHCCKHVIEIVQRPWHYQLLGVLWTTLEQELKPRVERIQKYYEVFECELWSARVRGDEQDLEGRFTEQEAVEGESKLRSLISRAGDKLSILESGQGQIDKRRAKKRKQQLLDSLSTHDYLTPLKQSRRKRHGGTAEWLFEMQEFDHWMSGTDCPVIFCSGKIGSGKTVLAASLIDRILIEKHDPDIFVSFFFVRFDDHESLKSENILKSILWQALDKTGLPDWVDILLEAAQGILSYELENLVKMLDMVAKSLKRLYIIIDGLDECQKRERDDLLNALTSLLSVKPDPNIRVFLSGRESVSREVERSFPELKRVSMNCQIAQSNISTYIEGAIKGKLHSEDLVVGNKDLIEEIKEALRNGADGILDELKEAISIEFGQESLNPEQLPNNIHQINSFCENLVHVDEEKKIVQFAHHTVRKFLIEGNLDASLHYFQFELKDADHHTGEMCVTYLNFNDFKTKIVPKPKPPPRLDIAPIEIARTALKNEQRSQDYLQRIAGLKLDSEEYLASIDVAERLANLQRDYAMSPTRGLQLKHRFLAYASVNMILHTSDFEKGISKTWDIWKNMIVHGHEHISYPWGDRLFNPNDPIMLRWALKKKQYALIRLIYTRMVGQSVIRQIQRASAVEGDNTLLDISLPSATRHDIDQLLHPAILFDHPQVVERLLTEGADPNAKGDKWTALNLAARCGFPDVLEVLLAAGANPNAEGPDIERSVRVPLQAAAWKGHLYAVDRLLMAGANVNGGSDGETALLLAADSGHLDVVQRLQDAGADVSIRSAVTHRTPIQHAVQRGYVSIVKRLLAAGADVNTGVKDGDSLLMIAIDRNHFQILDVLIAAGASVNVLDNPSPLEIAASHGNVTILNKLLAAGANANSLNGSRALKIAIDNRYIQIVDRLKASGAREISSGFTRGSKR